MDKNAEINPVMVGELSVLKHWVKNEIEKEHNQFIDVENSEFQELMTHLKAECGKRIAPALFQDADNWRQKELSEEEFREIMHFPGNDWKELSNGGNYIDVAQTIDDAIEEGRLWELMREYDDKDFLGIIKLCMSDISEKDLGKLILADIDEGFRLIDGCHRSSAIALKLLKEDEYHPIEAYIAEGNF